MEPSPRISKNHYIRRKLNKNIESNSPNAIRNNESYIFIKSSRENMNNSNQDYLNKRLFNGKN